MGISPVKPGPGQLPDHGPGDELKNQNKNTTKLTPGETQLRAGADKQAADALLSPKTADLSVPRNFSPLKETLLSLGLSQDKLSSALLIFTRFFSLPAGSADMAGFLAELRREVLNAAGNVGDENAGDGKKTENRSLAAAVLADKGVKLSPEAFAGLIAAMDPEEDGGFGGGNPWNNQGNGNADERRHDEKGFEKELSADELQVLFDDFMGWNDSPGQGKQNTQRLLGFLNRIQGKNGQRWVVWPFRITIKGIEIKVLVRLLIKEHGVRGRLILDAAAPLNSWRFILDNSGEKRIKAGISVYPQRTPAELRAIGKETEKFLSVLGPVDIEINNGERFPSLADFLEKEVLRSINKEV